MTLHEATEILDRHQAWRTGADIEMIEPQKLTIAISVILKHLKNEI